MKGIYCDPPWGSPALDLWPPMNSTEILREVLEEYVGDLREELEGLDVTIRQAVIDGLPTSRLERERRDVRELLARYQRRKRNPSR